MNSEHVFVKFEAYLLTEKRVAQNTFDAYKRDLNQFASFLKRENITLAKITEHDLKTFLRHLHALKLSACSVSRKISTLKSFFVWVDQKFGYGNVAESLQFPKIEKKLPRYLTQEEIKQLFAVAEQDTSATGQRNKMMLYLMYVSGMRVTELTTLHVSAIHFDTGFIDVQGKGGKQRMIPIPQPMLTLLRDYIETVQKIILKRHDSKRDYLFPVQYGNTIKPISRQAAWVILKKLCKKSSIERSVSPHQLRHSLATHMLQNGADLRSLQMLLGHENISTVQVYTHVDITHLREVYDKKHPRS